MVRPSLRTNEHRRVALINAWLAVRNSALDAVREAKKHDAPEFLQFARRDAQTARRLMHTCGTRSSVRVRAKVGKPGLDVVAER